MQGLREGCLCQPLSRAHGSGRRTSKSQPSQDATVCLNASLVFQMILRIRIIPIAPIAPAKAREYTRALTAVKLDKMFARPLVGALDGHGDGIFCSATSRKSLVQFLSGSTRQSCLAADASVASQSRFPKKRGIVSSPHALRSFAHPQFADFYTCL